MAARAIVKDYSADVVGIGSRRGVTRPIRLVIAVKKKGAPARPTDPPSGLGMKDGDFAKADAYSNEHMVAAPHPIGIGCPARDAPTGGWLSKGGAGSQVCAPGIPDHQRISRIVEFRHYLVAGFPDLFGVSKPGVDSHVAHRN